MRFFKKGLLMLQIILLAVSMMSCRPVEVVPQGEVQDRALRKLLFVTDDVEADFSALCWRLLQECASDAGAQVTLLEVQHQADKASTALNQASEGLYDLVVLDRLSNETATEWVRRNAGYYPEVHYLCLDALAEEMPELNNVTWVLWDDQAIYYAYGALAALNSLSGTVAFWGNEPGIRSETSFLSFYAGASQVSPHIRALYYTPNQIAGSQELLTSMNALQLEQADVLCCQTDGDPNALLQLLTGVEMQPWILVGGAELTIGQLQEFRSILACSWFHDPSVLEELFTRCCSKTPENGIYRCTWSSGDIRLRRGKAYPGELEQDAVLIQKRVERDAREGKLDMMLSVVLNEEERLQKIALAGDKGEN